MPFFRITIHALHGAFGSVVAMQPYVRVHLMDAKSGRWIHKAGGLAVEEAPHRASVFNMSDKNRPYLRTARGGEKPAPWQPRSYGPSQYVQPFATAPARLGPHRGAMLDYTPEGSAALRAPPRWEESFLIMEGLHADRVLLFEILDHLDEKQPGRTASASTAIDDVDAPDDTKGFEDVSAPLGWGFLGLTGPTFRHARPQRLRLQLRKTQRLAAAELALLHGFGAAGDEELGEGSFGQPPLPDVCIEYQAAKFRSQRRAAQQEQSSTTSAAEGAAAEGGWLSATAALFSRAVSAMAAPSLEPEFLPLVLEISMEMVTPRSEIGAAALELQLALARAALGTALGGSTAVGEAGIGAGGAADGGEAGAEVLEAEAIAESQLAPHHARRENEPCAIPDAVHCQLTVGTRGATRLSISPSGKHLAAAVASRNGTFEIHIFDVATGRLHAQCTAAHDAFIYDLAWHVFKPRQEGSVHVHPLLISCSGDSLVRIFEVPEDPRLFGSGGGARRIRLHTSLYLPSHVYTLSVHPALSADPHQLVLVCGGHNFGIVLCKIIRARQSATPDGSVQRFVPQQPHWQEEVRYDWDGSRPDILCLRFTKQQGMTADNLYASDSQGNLMLFQVRFDATLEGGRGGVRTSFVRIYSMTNPIASPIHGIEIVTQEMLKSKRLRHSMLHAIDDWVVLYSRDSTIRLASLQRGVVKVETQMTGHSCWRYPVRGTISPDGLLLACGSETGELYMWSCEDGKALPKQFLPRVELAGPILDVVWSWHHHLLACCAYDDEAPPVVVLVGAHEHKRLASPRELLSPKAAALPVASPMPPLTSPLTSQAPPPAPTLPPPMLPSFQPRPRESSSQLSLQQGPPSATMNSLDWASQWMDMDTNPRSAVSFVDKRTMKEQILRRLVDSKGAEEVEQHFANARNRTLPGGL